jgi:hypothetical protein
MEMTSKISTTRVVAGSPTSLGYFAVLANYAVVLLGVPSLRLRRS